MQYWRGVFLLLALPWAGFSQVSISPTNLPDGLVGSSFGMKKVETCAYMLSDLSMKGSTKAPFKWSVTGGSLPPGLTLNSTGVFEGEPTQPGTYSFVLGVTDANGLSGTRDFTVKVLPTPTCTTESGKVGRAQVWEFGCDEEGVFVYSSAGGTLPPGVSINSSTGDFEGTPTQAGTFEDLWRCKGSQPVTFTLNVRFVITGGTAITAAPQNIDLSLAAGDNAKRPIRIETAQANPVQFSLQAVTSSGGNWLTASASSGSVSAAQPAVVELTAKAIGLEAGVYTGSVTVSAGAAPVIIPVTLTVRRLEKQLQLSQNGVTIEMERGAPAFTRSFFRVADEGDDPDGIEWTARAETLSGGNWLAPVPTSGNTNDSRLEGEGATINASGLQPGAYYGFLEVSAPGAGNSPLQTTVTLNVRPDGQAVTPQVTPGGAIFIAEQGSNDAVQQQFRISNTTASELTFAGSATTDRGGAWLIAGPNSSIGVGSSIGYGLTAQIGTLARGVYRGQVTLSFSNGTTSRIRIALVIVPAGTFSAALKPERRPQSVCAPSVTVPVFTQVGSGGPPQSGLAQPITVQVVDDCGNPVNRGSAVLLVSGTNQEVPLQNFGGDWSGAWTPTEGGGGNQLTLTAEVTSEAGLTGTTNDGVSIQTNANPPPAVFDRGVVHAASFEGEPLAPGSMISIFGSNLSTATVTSGGVGAPSLPLTTELAGTRVTIGGTPLPLLFARADQVNAIIPFELGDRSTEELSLVVQRTDMAAISTAVPIRLSKSRPGLFPGSVLDQAFAFISSDNRAAAGDAVQAYASGLGLVDPPVATGEAATANPLSHVVEPVQVTVGGKEAQVLFAGLSPNFAGLFQVNFVIPQGVPAGEAELVIIVGGQPSQKTKMFVR